MSQEDPLPITLPDLERLLYETRAIVHQEGLGTWFERRGMEYETMYPFYMGLMGAATEHIYRLQRFGDDGTDAIFELILTTFLLGWMMKEQYGRGRP
jgi:hypothetical protein